MINKRGMFWGYIIGAVILLLLIFVGIKLVRYIKDSNSGLTEVLNLNPDAIIQEADMEFENENYYDAIDLYEDFLKKFPDHRLAIYAQFQIGEAYSAMEEYNDALIAYEKTKDNYEDRRDYDEWEDLVQDRLDELID